MNRQTVEKALNFLRFFSKTIRKELLSLRSDEAGNRKFFFFKKEELDFVSADGNLLPLSQSINSSLQNDCFEDKKNPKYNDHKEKIRQGYEDGSHSEIEVAQYEDWNAETILDRGLKLLDFLERRWNLKFEDKQAKMNLLFLEFMKEKR